MKGSFNNPPPTVSPLSKPSKKIANILYPYSAGHATVARRRGDHNDAVRPSALIHWRGIQGGTEGFDSAAAKADRFNNRVHQEMDASGEGTTSGDVARESD
jgi:hypothetical protein